MPEVTYLVRCEKLNGNVEIWEHVWEDLAKEHFASFDDTDADIYKTVQLFKRDYNKNEDDVLLEEKVFD